MHKSRSISSKLRVIICVFVTRNIMRYQRVFAHRVCFRCPGVCSTNQPLQQRLTDKDIRTVVNVMRMRYRRMLTVVMPKILRDCPFLQNNIIIKLFIDMAGKS